MDQHQTALLKFAEYRLGIVSFRANPHRVENDSRLPFEFAVEIVKKFIVTRRRDSAEEQGLDVDRSEARGPFEALKPQRDVLRVRKLAAAIAGQEL